MKDLIDVFKMKEISRDTRAKIIIELGKAINGSYGTNLTEPIVYELVELLNPDHKILYDKVFCGLAGAKLKVKI